MVTHNLIVGGGTIAAGVLGVAFQSLASHEFKPADFGSVFAVVTLITFVSLPASAFTLLMARETSRGMASGDHVASATLLRRGNRALLLFGIGLASLIALSSPALAPFLDVPAELLLAAAVGLPFGLALPLVLGEFQGEQRFMAFSLLITGQAGLKLGAAITLGFFFGPVGIIAGISLATVAIYLVALRLVRRRLAMNPNLPWWRPARQYLIVVVPSTLSLAVLLSADVLLVKHFFPTRAAGEYAAVAALGRAIFWGATGVAAVLFPKVVFRASLGRSGSHLVFISLVLVVLGGLAGLTVLSVASSWLLTTFAGDAYSSAASYLPWYALGMTMLGCIAVLVATLQSQGRVAFLAVLVPLALTEPALLMTTMHQGLLEVVRILDASMATILVSLAAFYFIQERLGRVASQSTMTAIADQPIAELAPSR